MRLEIDLHVPLGVMERAHLRCSRGLDLGGRADGGGVELRTAERAAYLPAGHDRHRVPDRAGRRADHPHRLGVDPRARRPFLHRAPSRRGPSRAGRGCPDGLPWRRRGAPRRAEPPEAPPRATHGPLWGCPGGSRRARRPRRRRYRGRARPSGSAPVPWPASAPRAREPRARSPPASPPGSRRAARIPSRRSSPRARSPTRAPGAPTRSPSARRGRHGVPTRRSPRRGATPRPRHRRHPLACPG